MAKRVGANSRKNIVARKSKRKQAVRKYTGRCLIAIVCVLAASTTLYLGYGEIKKLLIRFETSALLSVKEIIVKGTTNIPQEDVLSMSGLKTGVKLYSVKEKSVDTLLYRNPWVESVKLIKNFKGILKLEIVERKPVAIVNIGRVGLVDMHGIVLPLKTGVPSDLPLISGLSDTVDSWGRQVIVADDMKRLREFFKGVEQVDEEMLSTISQIDMSKTERIRLTFKSCPTVFELDGASVALRLSHLKELEAALRGLEQIPERINLCYQNLAFVTQPQAVKSEVIQAVSD